MSEPTADRGPRPLLALLAPTVGNVVGTALAPLGLVVGVSLVPLSWPLGVAVAVLTCGAPALGRTVGIALAHRKRAAFVAPVFTVTTGLAVAFAFAGAFFANMAMWSGPPSGLATANKAALGFLLYGSLPLLIEAVVEASVFAAVTAARGGAGTTAAVGVLASGAGLAVMAWCSGFISVDWTGMLLGLLGYAGGLALTAVGTVVGAGLGLGLSRFRP
jgi:hypothetical protein